MTDPARVLRQAAELVGRGSGSPLTFSLVFWNDTDNRLKETVAAALLRAAEEAERG